MVAQRSNAQRVRLFSGVLTGLLGLSLAVQWTGSAGAQPKAADAAPSSTAASAVPGSAPASAAPVHKAKSPKVKLTFRSSPGGANVYYGKRLLGSTPFDVEWKRDSGPVDVAVKMGGFYTVNSRVYTGRDDTLSVKLTKLRDGHTIYGYKAPLKDAGVAPPSDVDEDAPE